MCPAHCLYTQKLGKRIPRTRKSLPNLYHGLSRVPLRVYPPQNDVRSVSLTVRGSTGWK